MPSRTSALPERQGRGLVLNDPRVQQNLVSGGAQAEPAGGSSGLIEEGPELDTQALRDQFDRSQRMRSLEAQIKALQSELKSCEVKECDE